MVLADEQDFRMNHPKLVRTIKHSSAIVMEMVYTRNLKFLGEIYADSSSVDSTKSLFISNGAEHQKRKVLKENPLFVRTDLSVPSFRSTVNIAPSIINTCSFLVSSKTPIVQGVSK